MVRYSKIRKFRHYLVGTDGSVWSKSTGTWKLLAPSEDGKGYPVLNLYRDGKKSHQRVHTLILTTFRGKCPKGQEACHWNRIKTDNRLRNLRWATRTANMRDQYRHGTRVRGERDGYSKITSKDVIKIRASTLSNRVVAKRLGISERHAWAIRTRRYWRHV